LELTRIEALIRAMKDWDQQSDERKRITVKDLIFMVGFKIGYSPEDLTEASEEKVIDEFKTYILSLEKDTGMFEEFIVKALLNEIDEYLEGFLVNQARTIDLNENMIDRAKENEKIETGKFEEHIRYLKSPEFREVALSQLDTWRKVRLEYFSLQNLRGWESDDFLSSYNNINN